MNNRDEGPHLLTLLPGQKSPEAGIDEAAWIAGRWEAEAFGGLSEEIWSPPFGPTMMGMYKLIKDGEVVFYELLIIKEEAGSLVLKLKHFNPDLTGWEEKGETVDFLLVKVTPHAVYFDGLTFKKVDDETMKIYLAMNRKEKEVHEEVFLLHRVE